jgi:hypothetical protein
MIDSNVEDPMLSDCAEEILAEVRDRVRAGHGDPATVVQDLYWEWAPVIDNAPGCDELTALLERAVAGEVAALRAEQDTWPPVTDCDRLDEALAAVARDGVLVLPYLEDGDEVLDELRRAREEGRQLRGTVVLNAKAVHAAVSTGVLDVEFSAEQHGGQRGFGEELVQTFRDHGLDATWDRGKGVRSRTLQVALTWQRRLPESGPVG